MSDTPKKPKAKTPQQEDIQDAEFSPVSTPTSSEGAEVNRSESTETQPQDLSSDAAPNTTLTTAEGTADKSKAEDFVQDTASMLDDSDKSSIQEPTPAKAKKSGGNLLIGSFLVLGWIATGAVGYWYYQQQQAENNVITSQLHLLQNDLVAALDKQKAQQEQALEGFRKSLTDELITIERAAGEEVLALSRQVQEQEQRLNGQQERLAALSTTSREDWLLAEAEYLLRLASQRVLLERDSNNVVALLVRADAIVERVGAGLGDRELFAVRRALAEEITALKMVAPVDSEGLYLKLGALAQSINDLPTLPMREERFQKTETQIAEDQSAYVSPNPSLLTQLKVALANVIAFIDGAFSLKSEDELANPIVTQERLQLIQLNTRLLVEQAQISLLKQDNVSYQASLTAASKLATQYYFDSPARNAFAAQLNELAALDIAPALPDISGSLKLLHTYIAEQHRLHAPTAGHYSPASDAPETEQGGQ